MNMLKNKILKIYILISLIIFISTLFFNNLLLTSYVLIMIILGLVVTCLIYIKIKKVDDNITEILDGDYRVNIKNYDEGYISNLRNNIYKVTIKLREQNELLMKNQKYIEEVLEDISHQIKTPLTSMYTINDIVINEKDEKIRREFLMQNRNQIERIEWLVTSLLKISRLDSGTVKLKYKKVKTKEIIKESLRPINVLIELKNIKLELNLDDSTIYVDYHWTSEALLNIIKNACEHTHSKIIISSSDNPIYTEIKITDDGKGISKKDLKYIFKRFYKGEHNKDSIGIGLNMANKIITMEGGNIECVIDNGTTFIIKLYKHK